MQKKIRSPCKEEKQKRKRKNPPFFFKKKKKEKSMFLPLKKSLRIIKIKQNTL